MLKALALSIPLGCTSALPLSAAACQRCAPAVRAGVFNGDFLTNAMLLGAPLLLIAAAAAVLHRLGERP